MDKVKDNGVPEYPAVKGVLDIVSEDSLRGKSLYKDSATRVFNTILFILVKNENSKDNGILVSHVIAVYIL